MLVLKIALIVMAVVFGISIWVIAYLGCEVSKLKFKLTLSNDTVKSLTDDLNRARTELHIAQRKLRDVEIVSEIDKKRIVLYQDLVDSFLPE